MDGIIEILSNYEQYINIGIGIAIFLVLLSFKKQITEILLRLSGGILFSKKPEHRTAFEISLRKPISIFIVVLGAFIGLYMNFKNEFFVDIFKIITIMIFCWGIICYVSDNVGLVFNIDCGSKAVNEVAIKFFSNILKAITVCFAIVMVISELGFNINGLLTGLGVGGLAVSLATQDTLKNLVSGFVIIFDKPFDVGDLIETSDFKGTVEDITMRSTRIRKLDDSVIIVPNSVLSDSLITNYARLTRKLVEFKVGLLYSTPEKDLKSCEKDIKEYLLNNELVDSQTVRVRFSEFEDSSINILIRCYINTTDIEIYYSFIEELNFKIKNIVEKYNTDFAFPTRSIFIEKN